MALNRFEYKGSVIKPYDNEHCGQYCYVHNYDCTLFKAKLSMSRKIVALLRCKECLKAEEEVIYEII